MIIVVVQVLVVLFCAWLQRDQLRRRWRRFLLRSLVWLCDEAERYYARSLAEVPEQLTRKDWEEMRQRRKDRAEFVEELRELEEAQ